jgi:23S rRNA (pseudouridine1915-N3)-methyltransferase
MRIVLVCVGRAKPGPERELADHYIGWAAGAGRRIGVAAVELREVPESRASRPADRQTEEATAIRAALPAGAHWIALDERGVGLDSAGFAQLLGTARDTGAPVFGLVIGGPDGLAAPLRQKAELVLAFGPMTWPHRLVRVMAAEQLYRAMAILSGHPYHRA